MKKEDELKELVKRRYDELALNSDSLKCGCCRSTAPAQPSQNVFTIMSEDYSRLNGYEPDADLGVGCGLPTRYARIKPGDTVIDLGSGAGNDCFIARAETGADGKVIGIDFSPQMLAKARANAAKRGCDNVEFREGDIENMPVRNDTADVVVSEPSTEERPHFQRDPASSETRRTFLRFRCGITGNLPERIYRQCRDVCRLYRKRHPTGRLPDRDPQGRLRGHTDRKNQENRHSGRGAPGTSGCRHDSKIQGRKCGNLFNHGHGAKTDLTLLNNSDGHRPYGRVSADAIRALR